MAELIKIIGSEVALSTASNVGQAVAVRLYNNTAGAVVVTRAAAGGATIGTVTMGSGEIMYMQKQSTDTLAAASAIRAAAVAIN